MKEATICRCLWPVRRYPTLSTHDLACPIERAALQEQQIEAAEAYITKKQAQEVEECH